MPDSLPETSTAIDAQPRAGCWFLLLPVGLAAATIVAYFVLFVVGSIGRPATGDRVKMTLVTCPEANSILKSRVEHIGLGNPIWRSTADGFELEVTLPGTPEVDETIPRTLSTRGQFTVLPAGEPVEGAKPLVDSDGVVTASFTMEGLGTPITLVDLTQAANDGLQKHITDHPDGRTSLWLDDQIMETKDNRDLRSSGQIRLYGGTESAEKDVVVSAERAVLLADGPLPCLVEVRQVQLVSAPAS